MPRTGRSARRRVTGVVASLGLVVVLGSCTTSDDGPPDPPASEQVALSVETVSGAAGLDEATRTEVETAIGDVLSTYVARAFLGPFPRRDFVPAFASFRSTAAKDAARDIDLLTAAPVQDATSVRATRLDSRLSLLVVDREVLGATAALDLAFAAQMPGGGSRAVTLRGRFMLAREDGGWTVFGYDLAGDDGSPIGEAS